MFSLMVGPIKPKHDVHHKCGVKCCLNPMHLRQLPDAKHPFEDGHCADVQMSKTYCPKGHLYDEENTRLEPHSRGPGYFSRRCRTCVRLKASARSKKKKEAM